MFQFQNIYPIYTSSEPCIHPNPIKNRSKPYMKVVIWKPPVRGGCKNFKVTPNPAATSYGPKNLDSYSSTKDINGVLTDFENFKNVI